MLVANDLPCGAVEPRKAVESGTAQDGVDGGAGDAQPPPDAVRAPGKHAPCSASRREGHLTRHHLGMSRFGWPVAMFEGAIRPAVIAIVRKAGSLRHRFSVSLGA